jgi:hypothetical protein
MGPAGVGGARCMRSLHAATWRPDEAPIRDPLRRRCALDAGSPELRLSSRGGGGLGLGLFCWGFAYCPKCGGWTFLGGPGEEPLCGHVVEGFLALFCGGSLGGPSATFCGCATWLAWWWISGASMGIPSSLLSISGLGPGVMRRIALHLDASSVFVGSVRPMFDGVGAGRRPGVLRLG